jgi:hypothetical protein
VAGNDHHPDGSTGSTGSSNVVHLRPRHWLEPGEVFVPIGGVRIEPDADRATTDPAPPDGNGPAPTKATDRGHASSWLGSGEETIPLAPAPDTTKPATLMPRSDDAGEPVPEPSLWAAADFWGEDAAHLQHALEAPAESSAEPRVESLHPQDSRRRERRRRRPLGLRTGPVLVVAVVAAALVIAVAMPGFMSAPAAPGRAGLTASKRAITRAPTGTHTRAASRATPSPGAAALLASSRSGQHRRRGGAHRPRLSRPEPSRRITHPHHRRPAVTTAAAARYIAPALADTPAPTTTYTSAASSPAPAGSTPAVSASPPSHAGPTGPVSLIGSGTSPSG